MSFSCASIIWIRFQGTFSGDFFFPKPPPLTKLPQFIVIGKNVKQNKNYNAPIINQTGFEIFASNDKIKDDKEIIQTSIEIFKKSKFKKGELNISNIEIFNALIDRLSLALRWKERIKRHFCREAYFNQLLRKLSSDTDINFAEVEVRL